MAVTVRPVSASTCCEAFGSAATRSELGSVQGWLMTIVRNRAIDAARRESAAHRPRLRLSLPPGTVKGRMRLGMQKLRDQFEVAGGVGA